MTFNDFINWLKPEQVDYWWNSVALTNAPEKVENDNWKYKLKKNGKSLPFKWALKELATHYNIDFIVSDFGSSLANRETFCNAFDFEIEEDLVYDNTEFDNFKKFYDKVPLEYQKLFQDFSNYLYNLVSENKVNPYKIRMALRNSNSEAMVIVGMRATQAFSIRNNKVCLVFILHESVLEVISPNSILSKEQFTGKDNDKWLVAIQVENWEEIPSDILQSNSDCFKQEYNSVKDSKRARWNSEANSTNSAYKFILFKGLDIKQFFNENKKFKMEYFDIEGILNFKELTQEPYDKNSEATKIFNDTRVKINYLSQIFSDMLEVKLINNYKEKINKQSGQGNSHHNYKDYILAGFIPTNLNIFGSDIFIKISFGFWEVIPKLHFQIDINYKNSNNPFLKDRNYLLNLDDFWLDVDDKFPKNWNELARLTFTNFQLVFNGLKKYLNKNDSHLAIPQKDETMKSPLNQILYGPPGTGKTYNTINKAISIANPEFNLNQNREILKAEYNRLVENGQIVFTTFHQSMSYEDFIEGIKPIIEEDSDGNRSVIYEIKNGVFKLISEKAQVKRLKEEIVKNNFNFDDAWDAIITDANTGLENKNELTLSIQTPNLGLKIVDVTEKGNLKLKPIYSEDAKEYIVSYSRTKTLQEAFPDLSVIKNIDKEFRAVIGGSNSTAYWAVINYINNKINSEKKSTTKEVELSPLPHVLIIDEINRGNVSQIFGELITLIEESKRIGKDEELKVTLPYSKKEFGVPANLYIIGTMNTADRSVEALDTALRRRFSFVEMMPDSDIVANEIFQDHFPRVDVMQKINQRIELLLDKNYTLGHSYFLKDNFRSSFKNEIIPLLQEYFYNDCGKIGLILGQGFVREKEISKANQKNIFADFETRNEIEIIKSYELIPFEEVDFESAFEILLA